MIPPIAGLLLLLAVYGVVAADPPSLTYQDILDPSSSNHESFQGESLVYVTPWNRSLLLSITTPRSLRYLSVSQLRMEEGEGIALGWCWESP